MKVLSFIIFFCIFLVSCGGKNIRESNFNKEIYNPYYSSNFIIEEDSVTNNVRISVLNPWQGAQNVTSTLLVSKNEDIIDEKNPVLKGKADRIICMSSTHVAMLDALGAVNKIVAVSGKQYITNPYIHRKDAAIPDIGYEGNIDYETLLAVKPDLVLLFSVNGESGMEPKLKELGVPYLYVGDYVEDSPLGKAEWIIPVAEVLGIRDKGIQKFDEISHRYESLKNKISDKYLGKPKIMVNAPFADSWFMPSTESYVARMIKDAGGEYIYKKNTGNSSMPIEMEEALKLVSEADYWINIGGIKNLKEFKSTFPKFINTDCVKKGNLYNNNRLTTPGGGNDCYESGVVNPDLILKDMIKIFHPELSEEDFTYYQKLE